MSHPNWFALSNRQMLLLVWLLGNEPVSSMQLMFRHGCLFPNYFKIYPLVHGKVQGKKEKATSISMFLITAATSFPPYLSVSLLLQGVCRFL